MTAVPGLTQPLHPTVRRSPYFERTIALGASDLMVYNWMYMPMDYGRDPREDYVAMVERVTLWDVGAERQCQLRGPDALALADYLSPRRLDDLPVGGCRYTMPCDRHGRVLAEAIALRPFEDVVWLSHASVDLDLWADAFALARGADVEVSQPDVAPLQVQGPRALDTLAPITDADLAALPRFRCAVTRVAGVDAVVSNTGWSKEAGFEIYPLGSERALRAVGRHRGRRRAARPARHRPGDRPRRGAGHHRRAVPAQLRHEPHRGRLGRPARPRRPRLRGPRGARARARRGPGAPHGRARAGGRASPCR